MKVFAILNGGGHTAETLRLVNRLGDNQYYYLADAFDRLTKSKVNKTLPVLAPRKSEKDSRIMSVLRMMITAILSMIYVLKYKPNVIVAVGGNLAVPIFLICKRFGVKTIFVESIARVKTLSDSGQLLYGKVDAFVVQWPYLAVQLKKSIWGGLLL